MTPRTLYRRTRRVLSGLTAAELRRVVNRREAEIRQLNERIDRLEQVPRLYQQEVIDIQRKELDRLAVALDDCRRKQRTQAASTAKKARTQ
jgi:hypothetical protein